jgi:hypothetical protein
MSNLDIIFSEEFEEYLESLIFKDYNTINEVNKKNIIENPISFLKSFLENKELEDNNYSENIKKVAFHIMSKNLKNSKFNNTLNCYINLFEKYDFKVIYKEKFNHKSSYDAEPRIEYKMYFWHQEKSLFINLDTINRIFVNSVNLYCEGDFIENNDKDKYIDILINRNFTCNNIIASNLKSINIDLLQCPENSLKILLNSFYFNNYWINISSTFFYSYLTHIKEENQSSISQTVWGNQMVNSLFNLSEEVRKSMIDNLCYLKGIEFKIIKQLGYSKNFFKVKEVIQELTQDDIQDVFVNDILFDLRYSNNYKKTITKKIKKLFDKNNIDNQLDFCYIIIEQVYSLIEIENKDTINLIKNKLSELDINDLILVKNHNEGFEYLTKNDILNITEDLIKIKKIQNKLINFG